MPTETGWYCPHLTEDRALWSSHYELSRGPEVTHAASLKHTLYLYLEPSFKRLSRGLFYAFQPIIQNLMYDFVYVYAGRMLQVSFNLMCVRIGLNFIHNICERVVCARYMLDILPITDWSNESIRPALHLLLRRLERLFSKFYKKPVLRVRNIHAMVHQVTLAVLRGFIYCAYSICR